MVISILSIASSNHRGYLDTIAFSSRLCSFYDHDVYCFVV